MTHAVRRFAVLLLCLTVADQSGPGVREFLLHDAALTSGQLASIARGDVVVKSVPTSDRLDIAVLGVIRIPASRATVVAAARGIGSPIHLFESPAKLNDVQALRLSA